MDINSHKVSLDSLDSANHWQRHFWNGACRTDLTSGISLANIVANRTLLVFSGVFTFLVDAYPLYAASALAANSFARSSFAAAFPLFGVQSRLQCASSVCGAPLTGTCSVQ